MATAENLVQAWREGWYEGLSLSEYLAIPAMSASGLVEFNRSPAHFRYCADHPKEPTDAMREGTALHLALLEPRLFEGAYVALGQCEGQTKDGRPCSYQGSVYRSGLSFCKTHDPQKGDPMDPGIQVISEDALQRIEGMKRAVLSHPDACRFFVGKGRSEVTGIARDPETGVLLKIRLDRDLGRASIHADVKTCTDASEAGFARQVGRMLYALRSQFYRRVMKLLDRPAIGSVLIAVEKQPPHGCAAYLLDEGDLAGFDPVIDRALAQYAECLRTNTWPGYPAGLRQLKLLPWDEAKPETAAYAEEEAGLNGAEWEGWNE